jgi:hypothetical protein
MALISRMRLLLLGFPIYPKFINTQIICFQQYASEAPPIALVLPCCHPFNWLRLFASGYG